MVPGGDVIRATLGAPVTGFDATFVKCSFVCLFVRSLVRSFSAFVGRVCFVVFVTQWMSLSDM